MITSFNSQLNLQIDVLTFNKNDNYKDTLIEFLLKHYEMIAVKSSWKEYLVLNTLFDSDCNDKYKTFTNIIEAQFTGAIIDDSYINPKSKSCMFNFPNNFFDFNIKQMKSDVVYIVSIMKAIIIMDETNYKNFLKTNH